MSEIISDFHTVGGAKKKRPQKPKPRPKKPVPAWKVHVSGQSFVVEAHTKGEVRAITKLRLGGLDRLPVGVTIKKLREETRG